MSPGTWCPQADQRLTQAGGAAYVLAMNPFLSQPAMSIIITAIPHLAG